MRFSRRASVRACALAQTRLPRRSVALRPGLSTGLPLVDASNEDLSIAADHPPQASDHHSRPASRVSADSRCKSAVSVHLSKTNNLIVPPRLCGQTPGYPASPQRCGRRCEPHRSMLLKGLSCRAATDSRLLCRLGLHPRQSLGYHENLWTSVAQITAAVASMRRSGVSNPATSSIARLTPFRRRSALTRPSHPRRRDRAAHAETPC